MPKSKLTFLLIVLLAAYLRFYKLGSIPPSLEWDETAHGYNAYSVLKTGRDEYGKKLPLYFRSFDDYKPPLYTYLVVISEAMFGVNDFAVRFPSVVFGTFTVVFTYLMTKELFRNERIALLSAVFLAISPWHIQFSRVAFETNGAVFWLVLGTWSFLKAVNSRNIKMMFWLSLTSLAYVANLYMYHNARVFTPLLSVVLAILYRDKLLKNIKYLIVPILIFVALAIPLIPIVTSVAGQLRYKGVSIFSDLSPRYKNSELLDYDQKSDQLWIGKILHNQRYVYVPILIDNYLSNFKSTYLFLTADSPRHHAPYVGILYLWDLPFILIGIYYLIKFKGTKTKAVIFSWFLLAPIPATISSGLPHALRTELYLPTYQIFIALGVYSFLQIVKNRPLRIFVFGLLLLNFLFYVHQYFLHLSYEYSEAWLYGRKEAAIYTESVKSKYDRVLVSTRLEQPHEFWLFFTKYDPHKYLAEGGTVSGGFLEDRNKLDKYHFLPLDYLKQKNEAKTLFVGLPKEFPGDVTPLKTIYYLNGQPAIYIVGDEK